MRKIADEIVDATLVPNGLIDRCFWSVFYFSRTFSPLFLFSSRRDRSDKWKAETGNDRGARSVPVLFAGKVDSSQRAYVRCMIFIVIRRDCPRKYNAPVKRFTASPVEIVTSLIGSETLPRLRSIERRTIMSTIMESTFVKIITAGCLLLRIAFLYFSMLVVVNPRQNDGKFIRRMSHFDHRNLYSRSREFNDS